MVNNSQNFTAEAVQYGEHTASMDTLLAEDTAHLLGKAKPMGNTASCYELKIPAGMTLNEAQQALFEEQARELGLSNVSAQKLLEISHRNTHAHKQAYAAQVARWAEEVRQDTELGGPAMENTLAYAKAGLTRFDPERKVFQLLQETGYANHPQVIRFLAAIGKAHAEDAVLFGHAAPARMPRHERLYGKYNT